MRHFFLAILFIVSLVGNAQQAVHNESPQHSFQVLGGGYLDIIGYDDPGYSGAIGYQIRFPNRFILGVELLTDQNPFSELSSSLSSVERWDKFTGYSGSLRLGYQVVDRKHFDFSISTMPNIYHRRHIIKTRHKVTNEHDKVADNATLIGLPLLAQRFEINYKINPTHAIGFVFDLNLNMETNMFNDIIAASAFLNGRVMLGYRISFSGK